MIAEGVGAKEDQEATSTLANKECGGGYGLKTNNDPVRYWPENISSFELGRVVGEALPGAECGRHPNMLLVIHWIPFFLLLSERRSTRRSAMIDEM